MSQSPYTPWQARVKTEHDHFSGNSQAAVTASRRSGSGDQQATYNSYGQGDQRRSVPQPRVGISAQSSSTSSLSGAMGDADITTMHRPSVTPPSGLASWASSPTSPSAFMTNDPNMNFPPLTSPPGALASYPQYTMVYSSETSPGLSSGYPEQFAHHQSRGPSSSVPMHISPSVTPAPYARHSQSPQDKDEEIRRLLNRVRELELVANSSRRRIQELEREVHGVYPGGLPSPLPTPTPTETFNKEWEARTGARTKLFCSLNRAGNALCAWHDSRRERRKYPPRMAPPGYLNCGCTFEEALFEESLARHNVGSYLPGDNVRMDPALRNPLLKLLQQRYGYRDGDFERDPVTGKWLEGEGAARWEQKVAAGATLSRRTRMESC